MQKLKSATEILWAAAAALTPEENFVQMAYAKDANGFFIERVDARQPHAVKWCVVAAIDNAAYALGFEFEGQLLEAQSSFLRLVTFDPTQIDAENFNNTHTHADVIAALYKAAELSEQGL